MERLVSVIVPVYNVEKYLCQCVDSILTQTYQNLEVILVDDGSSDGSPEICDFYAQKDKRISVIHKKNGGAAKARNIGLQRAKGEYIIYADSDDFWVGKECLQSLMEQLIEADNCDVLLFNMYYFYPSQNKLKPWPAFGEELLQCNNVLEAIVYLVESGVFPMSPCSKIIKKSFLMENNIYFPEGTVGEDIPWFLKLLSAAGTVKFVNQYAYAYRKEVKSSVSSSFTRKKYDDFVKILEEETEKVTLFFRNKEVEEALLSFLAYEYCILMGMVNNFPKSERKQQIQLLEKYGWLLQYDLHPKVRKVKLLLRFTGARLTRWALLFYINKVVNRN